MSSCCWAHSGLGRNQGVNVDRLQVRVSYAKAATALSGAAGSWAARCKRRTAPLGIVGRATRNSWKLIAARSGIVSSSSCKMPSHCCRDRLRKRSTTLLSWSTDGFFADAQMFCAEMPAAGWAQHLAGAQAFCGHAQGTPRRFQ